MFLPQIFRLHKFQVYVDTWTKIVSDVILLYKQKTNPPPNEH